MNRIQIIHSSLYALEASIRPDHTEADMIKHAQSLLNPSTFKCQGCGCTGSCRHSVRYERSLITPENYQCHDPGATRITIGCFYCSICDYVHANLFDLIPPYSRHSLRFILYALADYADHMRSLSSSNTCHGLTVTDICQKWDISVSTIYRWKNRFTHHYQLWCAAVFLTDKMKDQLDQVSSHPCIARDFFRIAAFSFLQPNRKTHAHRIPGLRRSMPPPS